MPSECKVIPFPCARRAALVRGIARRALDLSPTAGEEHIQRSIKLQATVMRRKGVAEDLIAREEIGLSGAVRALIWDAVMAPSGGAR